MEGEGYKENSSSPVNMHLLFPDGLGGRGEGRGGWVTVGLISANVISHHCPQLFLNLTVYRL